MTKAIFVPKTPLPAAQAPTQPQPPALPAGELRLLRLEDVLQRFPVSKSSWRAGVASGRYPKGVKLGSRSVGWKSCDIDKLIQSLTEA